MRTTTTVAAAVLGAAASAIALAALFKSTYKGALERGENSLCMRVLGKAGTQRMLQVLLRLVSTERGRAVFLKELEGEAREKVKRLDARSDLGGNICFIGSSTFTYWVRMEAAFLPDFKVYNAAFGGSFTAILNRFADELCFKRQPQAIVYYCGTNDIGYGYSAEQAHQGFVDFVQLARRKIAADTKIFYVSILKTPQHELNGLTRINAISLANDMTRKYCQRESNLIYIDVDKPFVQDPNQYLNDGQHFSLKGHEKLAHVILEHLQANL